MVGHTGIVQRLAVSQENEVHSLRQIVSYMARRSIPFSGRLLIIGLAWEQRDTVDKKRRALSLLLYTLSSSSTIIAPSLQPVDILRHDTHVEHTHNGTTKLADSQQQAAKVAEQK